MEGDTGKSTGGNKESQLDDQLCIICQSRFEGRTKTTEPDRFESLLGVRGKSKGEVAKDAIKQFTILGGCGEKEDERSRVLYQFLMREEEEVPPPEVVVTPVVQNRPSVIVEGGSVSGGGGVSSEQDKAEDLRKRREKEVEARREGEGEVLPFCDTCSKDLVAILKFQSLIQQSQAKMMEHVEGLKQSLVTSDSGEEVGIASCKEGDQTGYWSQVRKLLLECFVQRRTQTEDSGVKISSSEVPQDLSMKSSQAAAEGKRKSLRLEEKEGDCEKEKEQSGEAPLVEDLEVDDDNEAVKQEPLTPSTHSNEPMTPSNKNLDSDESDGEVQECSPVAKKARTEADGKEKGDKDNNAADTTTTTPNTTTTTTTITPGERGTFSGEDIMDKLAVIIKTDDDSNSGGSEGGGGGGKRKRKKSSRKKKAEIEGIEEEEEEEMSDVSTSDIDLSDIEGSNKSDVDVEGRSKSTEGNIVDYLLHPRMGLTQYAKYQVDSLAQKKRKKVSRSKGEKKKGPKRAKSKFLDVFYILGDNMLFYHSTPVICLHQQGFSCQAQGADKRKCSFTVDGTDYYSFQEMRNHITNVHTAQTDSLPNHCPLCQEVIEGAGALLRTHIFQNHRPALAVCESCLKPMNPKAIRNHTWLHKNAEEQAQHTAKGGTNISEYRAQYSKNLPLHECSICHRQFRHLSHLKSHAQTHLPEEVRQKFECPECGKTLSRRRDVRVHIVNVHRPELISRALVFTICDKRFPAEQKARFQNHMRSHTGEKPFQCDECGKSFSSKRLLRSHSNVHTVKDKNFQCEFCTKSYKNSSNLRSHQRNTHKDLLPDTNNRDRYKNVPLERRPGFVGPKIAFPCQFCCRVFPYKSRMTKHVNEFHPHDAALAQAAQKEQEADAAIAVEALLSLPQESPAMMIFNQ